MDIVNLVTVSINDIIRYKFGKIIKKYNIIHSDEEHLHSAMNWLKRSHDITNKQGSSKGYSLLFGWLRAFPETTGYIIPTFFDYARQFNDVDSAERAIKMAEWLMRIQLSDGGCMEGPVGNRNPRSIVFNTGQMLFGLIRAYRETNRDDFLEASIKAGNFLVSCIDVNGCYYKNLYNNIIHTYNVRCSWALLELYLITDDIRYKNNAIKNLDWTIEQQLENGWYKNNNFKPDNLPNTHGIAYATRGLLESYSILKDEKYLKAAYKTAEKMMFLYETRRWISATHSSEWKYKNYYICVTGNIQFAIIWMRLYEITNDIRFFNSALKVIDYVKTIQNLNTSSKNIKGAIKGSQPIFGRYAILQYPNWASKFFADALMMKINIMEAL